MAAAPVFINITPWLMMVMIVWLCMIFIGGVLLITLRREIHQGIIEVIQFFFHGQVKTGLKRYWWLGLATAATTALCWRIAR
jgi:hypothetical protein